MMNIDKILQTGAKLIICVIWTAILLVAMLIGSPLLLLWAYGCGYSTDEIINATENMLMAIWRISFDL